MIILSIASEAKGGKPEAYMLDTTNIPKIDQENTMYRNNGVWPMQRQQYCNILVVS